MNKSLLKEQNINNRKKNLKLFYSSVRVCVCV